MISQFGAKYKYGIKNTARNKSDGYFKATPLIEQFTFLICQNQRINAIYFDIKKKKCKFGSIALNYCL